MFCEDCGDIDTIAIDGYIINDRPFEGLYFFADVVNGRVKNVRVRKEDREYFEQFNTRRWLKDVQEFMQDMLDDGDFGSFVCGKCFGQTVWLSEKDYADYTIGV